MGQSSLSMEEAAGGLRADSPNRGADTHSIITFSLFSKELQWCSPPSKKRESKNANNHVCEKWQTNDLDFSQMGTDIQRVK